MGGGSWGGGGIVRIYPFEAGEAGSIAAADTGMDQAGESGRTGRAGNMVK